MSSTRPLHTRFPELGQALPPVVHHPFCDGRIPENIFHDVCDCR
jgi:hypothetical protein